MKKVLALVLAVVLAFGMTTVAFAYTNKYTLGVDETQFFAEDDGKVDMSTGTATSSNVIPGKTVYFELTTQKNVKDSGGSAYWEPTDKLSDVSDYKISYSIDEGKNMIESVKLVSMKAKNPTGKKLFIAVKVKDNFILEAVDIAMDIVITSRNKNATITNAGKEVVNSNYDKFTFSITPKAFYNASGDPLEVDNGYVNIEDKGSVLTFADDADDVTMMFGNSSVDVEVQGNMKGQKDVFVRLATSNDAIEDKYPDATIRFFEGDRDTFRRDVNVKIPYESTVEKPYLYVVDAKGTLTKLYGGSNADKAASETKVEYDDVEGAFTFMTKTLNHYIISDTELKSTTSTPSTDVDAPVEGDKPTDGTQPNPGTGANDFVGLAVAMAVVSVAGIAVAKRK